MLEMKLLSADLEMELLSTGFEIPFTLSFSPSPPHTADHPGQWWPRPPGPYHEAVHLREATVDLQPATEGPLRLSLQQAGGRTGETRVNIIFVFVRMSHNHGTASSLRIYCIQVQIFCSTAPYLQAKVFERASPPVPSKVVEQRDALLAKYPV